MSSSEPERRRLQFRAPSVLYPVSRAGGVYRAGDSLYVLQVARHDDYQARAENNRIREIPIPAPRGRILDRYERVLVDSVPAFNVVVTPEDITDKEDTLNALAQNLDVDRAEVLAELNNPLRPKSLPVLVKQNASPADLAWVGAQ